MACLESQKAPATTAQTPNCDNAMLGNWQSFKQLEVGHSSRRGSEAPPNPEASPSLLPSLSPPGDKAVASWVAWQVKEIVRTGPFQDQDQ